MSAIGLANFSDVMQRSPDEAKRNPGLRRKTRISLALHPGYGGEMRERES